MKLREVLWGMCLKVLKRWTRAGLLSEVQTQIKFFNNPVVVSVGGYGPVDDLLKSFVREMGGEYFTFDINGLHNPEIVGDVTNISSSLTKLEIVPDIIVALEVFEHVPKFELALLSCYEALNSKGVLIMSTPWITPIHDRPHDYYRFTPTALKLHLSKFQECTVLARGNYFDSIVALMLRGLFSGGHVGKLFMAIGILLSLMSPLPKLYSRLDCIDSCLGYFTIAKK